MLPGVGLVWLDLPRNLFPKMSAVTFLNDPFETFVFEE